MYIVLELRTFVLKNRVSSFCTMFLISEQNGEKKKVQLSLSNNILIRID